MKKPSKQKPVTPHPSITGSPLAVGITVDDRNANRGTERGLGMLEHSLRTYGAGRGTLADKNGRMIAGNKTVETAIALGIPLQVVETDGKALIVVKRKDLDLDSPEGRALAIADNRVAELNLDWDPQVLAGLFAEGVPLDEFFLPDELQALLTDATTGAKALEGTPTPPSKALIEKWGVLPGTLWQIGPHRLLCGDSTLPADVARLMGADRAVCMWTDPPYGVGSTGGIGKKRQKIEGDEDDPKALRKLLDSAFTLADTLALAEGAALYVCHAPGPNSGLVREAFDAQPWVFRQGLVWVKHRINLGHNDYHYRHEPILFGYKKRASGRAGRGGIGWWGGDDAHSVFFVDMPHENVWHPTAKPVELVRMMLSNSSPIAGIVYDPFSGSGATLIAAHELTRIARGIEKDPLYVAHTIERLSLIGLKPVLVKP